MADYATLAQVKEWLGITGTGDDALLTRAIGAASEFVRTWLGYEILSASYTERRNGLGGDALPFAHYPVTAVSSLTVNSVSIPASSGLIKGYVFDERSIYYIQGNFPQGRLNIGIVYTAGLASTPADITQAVIDLVSLRYKERDRIGITSKSLAGESISFAVKEIPDTVLGVLKQYRKVVPL